MDYKEWIEAGKKGQACMVLHHEQDKLAEFSEVNEEIEVIFKKAKKEEIEKEAEQKKEIKKDD